MTMGRVREQVARREKKRAEGGGESPGPGQKRGQVLYTIWEERQQRLESIRYLGCGSR